MKKQYVYKGSVTAFCRYSKCLFPKWILRFPNTAKTHRGMLTNIILFWGFWVHFCENGTKMIKKRQVLQGFRQCISPVLQMLVFPMNSQVSQHHEITSWNAYKHNAFLMLLSAFLRIWLRNDQETTGFIRVPWLHFAVTPCTSFPNGF